MPKSIKYMASRASNAEQRKSSLRLKQKRESASIAAAVKKGKIDAVLVGAKKGARIYADTTSNKVYRILIEKMNESAIVLNGEGTILYCNSSFARILNLPLQKVIGSKFRGYIDSSSIDQFDDSIKKGTKGGDEREIAVYNINSRTTPVLMSVNSLRLNGRSMLSVVLTDLTLRNRNQEELREEKNKLQLTNKALEGANKDLTVFTYISSHDLQEPLRKIQNFVTMITNDEGTVLSDPSKINFERCRAAAHRMQNLIEDLLTYSHAKSIDRAFELVDLNLIVNEVKIDSEQAIKDTKALVITHLGEARILRTQFVQVIQNLISNSLKFSQTNHPPQIRIESEVLEQDNLKTQRPDVYLRLEESAARQGDLLPQGNYCHITYTDNGIGFEPQYKDKIFEVFQRLHTQTKFKGTGMGLAICKRIIENHQGIITASGQLDVGARFDIYIPSRNTEAPV